MIRLAVRNGEGDIWAYDAVDYSDPDPVADFSSDVSSSKLIISGNTHSVPISDEWFMYSGDPPDRMNVVYLTPTPCTSDALRMEPRSSLKIHVNLMVDYYNRCRCETYARKPAKEGK